uniref:DNA methyltransferase n=1 Tax=Acidocella sp. TaxID=50710 RepID=UPI003457FEB2
MRLSWNEIRARAAAFATEWRTAHYERGQTQTFYNEFFEIFGTPRKRVAAFEEPVKKLGNKQGFIDLFWKGVLLVEHKSLGRPLAPAKTQALDYFPGLKDAELPRYILLSDFQTFELYDLETGTELKFTLADLPRHVEAFGFIMGVQKRVFKDQDPVNIIASELMGRLHDALKSSGYDGHDLERLLVRLVFCLFADDTGIFDIRDMFEDFIKDRTREDGSDLGLFLSRLFDVLNTAPEKRQKSLDEDLACFPYINGDLFAERLNFPDFNATMRNILLEACAFNWNAISPAIFGALFQSVMLPKERRKQGAHYTTERNILKVIQPLFLDNLRAEFSRAQTLRGPARKRALESLHEKLGQLTFFDPACGCGNFLIIAYRELRQLELEILRAQHPIGQRELDVAILSKLDVDQFYGIEISEFPARIAEIALWMMDHIMNNSLSVEFGESFLRIPLKKSPHILFADALETDWEKFLPPEKCSYVLGNPPFSGFVLRDEKTRKQMQILQSLGASGSRLDYVTAWFLKAGKYVQTGQAQIAFVATNSITQGEQVSQFWPALFDRYRLEISFAHRTFAWGSDARGVAHVHVVIIGLTRRDAEQPVKRLFSYEDINGDPGESLHSALSPYLFDAGALGDRHLVVQRSTTPLTGLPAPRVGSKPVDGGHYIIDTAERAKLVARHPDLSPFIRPYIGGQEFLNGGDRWILCLQKAKPEQIRRWPEIIKRIEAVRKFRTTEGGNLSKSLAETPLAFHVTVIPESPFLAIPEVSSERREYVPFGWLEPPVVPSN